MIIYGDKSAMVGRSINGDTLLQLAHRRRSVEKALRDRWFGYAVGTIVFGRWKRVWKWSSTWKICLEEICAVVRIHVVRTRNIKPLLYRTWKYSSYWSACFPEPSKAWQRLVRFMPWLNLIMLWSVKQLENGILRIIIFFSEGGSKLMLNGKQTVFPRTLLEDWTAKRFRKMEWFSWLRILGKDRFWLPLSRSW